MVFPRDGYALNLSSEILLILIMSTSEMLVPAGAQDIVPRGSLVALKTLVDARMRFSGDTRGDHLKVHHIMTGRGLMALGTVRRVGGRMSKFGDGPSVRGMTLHTVLTE